MYSAWRQLPLSEIADDKPNSFVDGPFGSDLKTNEYTEEGARLIQLQNIGDGIWIDNNKKFTSNRKFLQLSRHAAFSGDIVIAKMADPIARACIIPPVSDKFLVVADCIKLTPNKKEHDPKYIVAAINHHARHEAEIKSTGTTRQRINLSILKSIKIPAPSLAEQRRIAELLDTIDETIQKTEALIAKLNAIKQGLIHDLLTRGINENRNLRDPNAHPEQFQESFFGRIPNSWEIKRIGEITLSAIDGPFGSNIKTEHYVDEPGVRVVRLQNIGQGSFTDNDKAYISSTYADLLKRYEILGGDLIIASLGDNNNPIARACLYPKNSSPGIVKADCFRFRFLNTKAKAEYVMNALNCPTTRKDIPGIAQGVTRDRVNLTTIKKVRIPVPPIREQEKICDILGANDKRIQKEQQNMDKIKLQKKGLMHDLLTGKVRVKV